MKDVIHLKEDGFWYYWDETWSFEEGPYTTKSECIVAFNMYCKQHGLDSWKIR